MALSCKRVTDKINKTDISPRELYWCVNQIKACEEDNYGLCLFPTEHGQFRKLSNHVFHVQLWR
ncbi:hypothetical protein ES319_D12G155600v1 [Gossypium barbadense]|uniref:Uncharacterized protein n=2 Tax=Gossypium TaxID=3633 RepID=A0A5J5NYX4_GOSBA|nr:hypothetical protein ES319_D12G155600v1 [Gossypium barbadense]TYG41297.1 hypothetical protein ES288_D12G164600v1 [Gossypium darwinii]TYG41308.1 hypothetical protein ES288_D12G165600v1 [Gossypium darwinii]